MNTLYQHTMDPLPDNLQLKYEAIDVLTCGIMNIAEEICRHLFKGEMPLSPLYKNLILTLL